MINKKTSLYLDTSIFGGFFDDIFKQDTRLLFEKIKAGKYIVFISDLVKRELETAPENVKNLLEDIKYQSIEVLPEYEDLADEYLKEKVVGKTSRDDCIHIATATINNIDYLVSWNFKHIVNVERIKGYNSVNIKNGYKHLEIRSPKEMGVYDDD
ncbi:MAG: type II toxin-antitoxin system VapC family toxin [Chitinivibrionia bacterium]|nr:type II toxin-antitoxin system VapC family toxin [Chitinivibrionia bacterium]